MILSQRELETKTGICITRQPGNSEFRFLSNSECKACGDTARGDTRHVLRAAVLEPRKELETFTPSACNMKNELMGRASSEDLVLVLCLLLFKNRFLLDLGGEVCSQALVWYLQNLKPEGLPHRPQRVLFN